ncbi:hypothetical protein AR457_23125 [Streptomyces agglomeratus]|uniref:Secreted protein n=1 Tax=Streptomyces agglomeratus TaxID=285458 RepID=A0A1E5PBS9_9ACTN|nr:hypothetical protein [Streptomyces agglomeratus]OEJ26925.1 hypothetical protein AS594_23020 [Streptomyces agglomeratus]OEJ39028.1 hypothetical protein BGK70_13530 [Streptomyces agglomeratus]OEJ46591.1 hypothetical protein AR457_23125 [Streptomyces agglomeratus]OEJ51552.1 hypothetical protein BGK72_12970 [Streptomyces agglomeratus]OEJ58954.1 hypothetical protein BGM19_14070 [Streptomyces agglomeratus]
MDAVTLILILTLLCVAFVATGVYVSVKAVGAAKRGVDRKITQARRTVEDTALRAKSFGQVGVAGELAQLRLSLRTSMKATQEALSAGVAEDASLSESLGLFERLSAHGHELDDDLKRLEREPDRARVAERLPDLRERTERVTHAADSLRWAARDRAQRFANDDLATLSAQIEVESGALRHWATGPDADASWSAAADTAAADTAGAAGGAGGAAGRRAESGDAARRAASGPEAITARDPHRQTTYPWQKTARPEGTV